MKSFKNVCGLLMVLGFLAACAAQPHGKLNKAYTGQKFDAELALEGGDRFSVTVNTSTTGSGGSAGLAGILAIALVEGAINASSTSKARNGINLIGDAYPIVPNNVALTDDLIASINEAHWLNVSQNPTVSSDSTEERFVAQVGRSYRFDQNYLNLTHNVFISLRPVQDGERLNSIYDLTASSVYKLPDAKSFFTKGNAALWIENDGLHLKKAVAETSENVRLEIVERMKNPYQSDGDISR